MRIEHIAIWVNDLERMKSFYETYFDCKSNNKYHNIEKKFESYFLTFKSGARLEMDSVNHMTARLKNDGYSIVNGPRVTGDGYFESVIEDPEGNLIELTI